VLRGSGEKFRQAVAQGAGDDEFRGALRGAHGAQPGAEVAPDQSRVEGGEAVEQALSDKADLDVAMIGVEFSADGGAVGRGLVMEELVALKSAQRRHGAQPEMIRPGADGVECLFESDLDFEAQGVEPDDLGRREREVGGQEENLAAVEEAEGVRF
jgi:hypothetical protein